MNKYGTYLVYTNVKTGAKKEVKADEASPKGKEWVRDNEEEIKVASLIKEGK